MIDESDASQLESWGAAKCEGRARCGTSSIAWPCGGNVEIEGGGSDLSYKDPAPGALCHCERSKGDQEYDSGLSRAQYSPGQKVCVAYPARQHVAAACNSTLAMPDAGMRFFRTAVSPALDPETMDEWEREHAHGNGVHEMGVEDFKGFQRCPKYCDDVDHAMCAACFDLEVDNAPGVYTFYWLWDFKGLSQGIGPIDESYANCWEAEVAAGSGGGTAAGMAAGEDGKPPALESGVCAAQAGVCMW